MYEKKELTIFMEAVTRPLFAKTVIIVMVSLAFMYAAGFVVDTVATWNVALYLQLPTYLEK